MNVTPRPPTAYSREFLQLIRDKSSNFIGRQFIFAAINEFLHKCDRGYFTLVGAPGSGKSAILAKYATENPHVIYYSAEVEGKNRVDQFLVTICDQLMAMGNWHAVLPDNATEGSWFFSLLLQKISDLLAPDEPLIIAIDGCDRIDPNNQPPGTNLFYLPRYLPQRVYFLLSRRPFLREKSGLLTETPSQTLDLAEYPEQNQEDALIYIHHYLTTHELAANLKSWLVQHHLSEPEFSQQLAAQSGNNFMYLSQILPALAQGFYPQPFQFHQLPPGLEAYYHILWQHMQGQGLSKVELDILNILVQQSQPISADAIAQILDEDEYEVEAALENWFEFLHQQQINRELCYSLYHSSFRNFLKLELPPLTS
jgi:hypothetical protein